MARWVKSKQSMRIFKTATQPTTADGLAVGDIWIDTTSTAVVKLCTAVPGTFTTLAGTSSPTFTTPVLGVASATSINFGQDALNYYDEGTWTPSITFASNGTSSRTYTNQTGIYTRIGNVVTCQFRLSFSLTKGTASGEVRIAGLPFTSSTNPAGAGMIAVYTNAFVTVTKTLGLRQEQSVTYTLLADLGTGTMQVSSLNDASTQELWGSIIYRV